MTDLGPLIREAAEGLGFSLIGVTSGEPVKEALQALEAWSEAGHGADLAYMTRNPPERATPSTLMRGTDTVVSLGVNYWVEAPPFDNDGRLGRVARYAWGRDYHDVVIPRLKQLATVLALRTGAQAVRVACDYSPILERAFAERAGLGFFGKNTCLILPRHGSFFFLGEILLQGGRPIEGLDLPPSPPGGCGTCQSCLDACPSDAFPDAYVLDARRCISYLTIEHKGAIPLPLRPEMGDWLFGCDVCQDVCPFTRFSSPTRWAEFEPHAGVGRSVDLRSILEIDDEAAFEARFAGTPLLRPRRRGIQRNAAVVARNVGATGCVPALVRRVEEDTEALVRGHAIWALFGLDEKEARRLAQRARDHDPHPGVREEATRCLET